MDEEEPIKGILVGLGATFLFVGAWVAVVLLTSCTSAPITDAQHQQIATAVSNIVHEVTDAIEQARDARREEAGEASGVNSADPAQTAKPAKSGGAPVIEWKFGGFRGENAVEDPETQIADLRITRSRLSYRWAQGGCEKLGATSKTDAEHTLACAFYWDGSRWVGGKFDWISTSRTTRDWKNINEHYNGWNPDAFWAAPRRAFCIVGKEGRRRTNLLVTEEPK